MGLQGLPFRWWLGVSPPPPCFHALSSATKRVKGLLSRAKSTAKVPSMLTRRTRAAQPLTLRSALISTDPGRGVFPVAVLGPAWFSAIHGPFPGLRCVATGGVTVERVHEFSRQAGAQIVAFGASITNPDKQDALCAMVRKYG
jgi:hypothetical protein